MEKKMEEKIGRYGWQTREGRGLIQMARKVLAPGKLLTITQPMKENNYVCDDKGLPPMPVFRRINGTCYYEDHLLCKHDMSKEMSYHFSCAPLYARYSPQVLAARKNFRDQMFVNHGEGGDKGGWDKFHTYPDFPGYGYVPQALRKLGNNCQGTDPNLTVEKARQIISRPPSRFALNKEVKKNVKDAIEAQKKDLRCSVRFFAHKFEPV
jgi:hypothetical protein